MDCGFEKYLGFILEGAFSTFRSIPYCPVVMFCYVSPLYHPLAPSFQPQTTSRSRMKRRQERKRRIRKTLNGCQKHRSL
jgi:hypothetical protein